MTVEEAQQIFDGTMLGDGALQPTNKSAYFAEGLSAGDPDLWQNAVWSGRNSEIPQMQYLVHIMDCLRPLGIEFCEGHPKASIRVSRGKPYLNCCLESHTSGFLLTQWERWYRPVGIMLKIAKRFPANRKWYKILPDDIRLMPLTMAVWFEGDGSSEWSPFPWSSIVFNTNSFTKEEVDKLRNLLLPFGVYAYTTKNSVGKQVCWVLRAGSIDSVSAFFDLVEDYIHPCYQYKIKKPTHKL